MSLGLCFIKKLYSSKLARLLDTVSKFALFSVSGLKDKKLIKKQATQKLKHANSILKSFEYFCQISSKSIFIILSYTVSKLARFFETQCIYRTQSTATYGPRALPHTVHFCRRPTVLVWYQNAHNSLPQYWTMWQ